MDDGSTDGSWEVIERLAADDQRVRGIRFRGPIWKGRCVERRFASVTGDLILTLDVISRTTRTRFRGSWPRSTEGWTWSAVGNKFVHDPWHKVIPSRIFNWIVSVLTGVKLHEP